MSTSRRWSRRYGTSVRPGQDRGAGHAHVDASRPSSDRPARARCQQRRRALASRSAGAAEATTTPVVDAAEQPSRRRTADRRDASGRSGRAASAPTREGVAADRGRAARPAAAASARRSSRTRVGGAGAAVAEHAAVGVDERPPPAAPTTATGGRARSRRPRRCRGHSRATRAVGTHGSALDGRAAPRQVDVDHAVARARCPAGRTTSAAGCVWLAPATCERGRRRAAGDAAAASDRRRRRRPRTPSSADERAGGRRPVRALAPRSRRAADARVDVGAGPGGAAEAVQRRPSTAARRRRRSRPGGSRVAARRRRGPRTSALHLGHQRPDVVGRPAVVGLDEVGVLGRHLGGADPAGPCARPRR